MLREVCGKGDFIAIPVAQREDQVFGGRFEMVFGDELRPTKRKNGEKGYIYNWGKKGPKSL